MTTAPAVHAPSPTADRATPARAEVMADAITMLHRNVLHMIRYPALTVSVIAMPAAFLLFFVGVLGGTLGAGLPGSEAAGAAEYLRYVVPGILVITIAGGVVQTASIGVAQDMTGGIIARFRTMAISRSAVLAGHVLGDVLQGVFALTAVLGVALLLGFRAPAGVAGWTATAAVLLLITVAMTWLGVAMGITAKTVESASNLPLLLVLLPLLGSGFVPTESMPGWLQWFATYQPFTAFIETIRALLFGTDLSWYGWATLAWCAALGLGGYLWARSRYERRSVR